MATGLPVATGELVGLDYINGVSRGYWRKTTSLTVSGTADTDLLNSEFVIPAGALATNRILRVTAWGDWVQSSGGLAALPIWSLKYGGGTLLKTGTMSTVVTASSANRYGWRAVSEIMNLGNASVQSVSFDATIGYLKNAEDAQYFTVGEGVTTAPSASGSSSQISRSLGFTSAAVNTANAGTVALSVIIPTATSCNLELYGALGEII